IAETRDNMNLYVQSLDSVSARQLTAVASYGPFLFWSPDSRFIAFFSDGKLKKIAASGGSPQTICDAPDGRGGSWSQHGTIVLSPRPEDGLYNVSSQGGTPTPITYLDSSRHIISHRIPYFLPDGHHFLFFEVGEENAQGIYVGSLDNPEIKPVLKNETWGMFAQNQLLFVRERDLMAQPFNLKTLAVEGEARMLAEDVFSNTSGRSSMFWATENGTLVYLNILPPQRTRLIWMDRQGKQIGEIPGLEKVDRVRLSHDGRRILMDRFDDQSQKADLWVYDLERNSATRLTFNQGENYGAAWSWDDQFVYYCTYRGGICHIFRRPSSGAGEEKELAQSRYAFDGPDVSPDGRFLIYAERNPATGWDLLVLSLSGGQKPYPFVRTTFGEDFPRFSPDGKWVAFSSDKSGRREVYVRPFDHPEQSEWQVSTSGGNISN